MSEAQNPETRVDTMLGEIERLLKVSDLGTTLSDRGVNTSLALLAVQGLRAYLRGNKAQAVEDLGTVVEELGARLEASRERSRESS
jgi:hypothetical protein